MGRYLSYEFKEPTTLELEDNHVPLKLKTHTIEFKRGGTWTEPINDPNLGANTVNALFAALFPCKWGYCLFHRRQNSRLWIAVSYAYTKSILIKCLYGTTKIPLIDGYEVATDGTKDAAGVTLSTGKYALFYEVGKTPPATGTNKVGYTDKPPYEGVKGLSYNVHLASLDPSLSGTLTVGSGVGSNITVYAYYYDIYLGVCVTEAIRNYLIQTGKTVLYLPPALRGLVRWNLKVTRGAYLADYLCYNMDLHCAMNFYFDDGCYGYANPTWWGTRTAYKAIIGDEADGRFFIGDFGKYPALEGSPSGVWMAEGNAWAKIKFDPPNKMWDVERAFWIRPVNKDNSCGNQSGLSSSFGEMVHYAVPTFTRAVSQIWNGSWANVTPGSSWTYSDNYWSYYLELTASGLGTVKVQAALMKFIRGNRTAFTPAAHYIELSDRGIFNVSAKEIDRAYGDVLRGYKYGLHDRMVVQVV